MKYILYLTVIITLLTKNTLQYNTLIFDEDDLENLIDLTPQNDKKAKIVLPQTLKKEDSNKKIVEDDKSNIGSVVDKNDTIRDGGLSVDDIQKVKNAQKIGKKDSDEEGFYFINGICLGILALIL